MLLDHAPSVRDVEHARVAQKSGDGELLARLAAGDRAALAELYDRFGALVYGVAVRVVRNPSIAQEVTQEVFLWVWSNAGTFDRSRGSERAWLTTMAHRRAVDVVRSEQASRSRHTRVEQATVQRPFDEVAEAVQTRSEEREVRAALDTLTPIQRQAVELAYYQGLTYRQVAQALDLPVGTVKTRIRDGLRRLSAELGRVTPGEAQLSA